MATVSQAKFCPNCRAELVEQVKTCPVCRKELDSPTSEFFKVPYYLSMQMKEHADAVENRLNSKKPLSREEAAQFEKAKEEYETLARTMLPADRVAALVDAQHLLRHVIHSRINSDELGEIIGRGIAIGKLATSLNEYIRNGGAGFEPETRLVLADSGDTGRSAAAVAGSGDT